MQKEKKYKTNTQYAGMGHINTSEIVGWVWSMVD